MDWMNAQIFHGLTDEERREVRRFLEPEITRVRVAAGEAIHKGGDRPMNAVIVEEGVLRSVHYTSEGEELSAFYCPPGSSVFHIACLTDSPVNSYGVALQDAVCVNMPKAAFVRAAEGMPYFQHSLLMHICATSETLIEHTVTVQMKRPRQRICRYLLESGGQEGAVHTLPFNTTALATYLNMARPTLSRELHQMEKDGIITVSRGMLTISDMDKLYEELN